jgi:hypothetical protein
VASQRAWSKRRARFSEMLPCGRTTRCACQSYWRLECHICESLRLILFYSHLSVTDISTGQSPAHITHVFMQINRNHYLDGCQRCLQCFNRSRSIRVHNSTEPPRHHPLLFVFRPRSYHQSVSIRVIMSRRFFNNDFSVDHQGSKRQDEGNAYRSHGTVC